MMLMSTCRKNNNNSKVAAGLYSFDVQQRSDFGELHPISFLYVLDLVTA